MINGCNSSGRIIAAREKYGREKEKAQAEAWTFCCSLVMYVSFFWGHGVWILAVWVRRWGNRLVRISWNKQIIRTHFPRGKSGSDYIGLVPVAGVEPARCRHRRILNPVRLPIPSHRRGWLSYYIARRNQLQGRILPLSDSEKTQIGGTKKKEDMVW